MPIFKILNRHVNLDWCETSGNFLRKWFKIGIFNNYVSQSDPKILSLGPIFSTHLKVLAMSMWSKVKTDVKPVKTFWKKWPRTWILIHCGTQNGPIIRPLRPIFHTPLKVLAMSMWSNTDETLVKTIFKSDQSPGFWLTWNLTHLEAQKCGPLGHIPHTSESTCNEHVEQYWWDTSENYF